MKQKESRVRNALRRLVRQGRRVRWLRLALLASLACSAALIAEARANIVFTRGLSELVVVQIEQLAAKDALLVSLTKTLHTCERREHEANRVVQQDLNRLNDQLTLAVRRRDVATAGRHRLEHQTDQIEQDLQSLREAYKENRRRLREKETLISLLESPNQNKEFSNHRPPGPPVPAIDGHVVSVSPATSLSVMLSVGSDHMVEVGYRFSIYRGPEFVGKVVVERTLPGRSACRLLFVADGEAVRPGDSAATRLQ